MKHFNILYMVIALLLIVVILEGYGITFTQLYLNQNRIIIEQINQTQTDRAGEHQEIISSINKQIMDHEISENETSATQLDVSTKTFDELSSIINATESPPAATLAKQIATELNIDELNDTSSKILEILQNSSLS